MRFSVFIVLLGLLTGCAGKLDYVRPTSSASTGNIKIINHPRNAVWDTAVPQLGKQFFVINNLDKSSGLINISYSGDPQEYVDCGQISSYVKNFRGERTYQFPGSKADENYEVMENGNLFGIQRKMNLEGRVNVIFEEIDQNSTRVTVNVRYILTKQAFVQNAGGGSQNYSDTISFNSGGRASFPQADSNGTECIPTGKLEQDILSAMN